MREREIAASHLREFIRALIRERKEGSEVAPDAVVGDVAGLSHAERALLLQRGEAVLGRVEANGNGSRPVAMAPGALPASAPAEELAGPGALPPAAPPEAPAQTPAKPTAPAQVPAAPPGPRGLSASDASAVGSVLQALVTKCLEMLASDLCQVYLVEEHTLSLRAEAPPEPATITGPGSLPLVGGFAARVLAAGRPMRLGDVSELQGSERIWLDRGMWSIAAVALVGPEELVSGILVAARSHAHPFTDEELDVLHQLSDEVGLALASADLLSRAEELAVLKERIKLAREIHDGLASDLSAVVALFKYHEHRRHVDPEDADQLLQQMRTLVEGSLHGVRDILATLRPRPQNIRRLDQVLRRHVEDFGRTYGISAMFSMLGDDSTLVPEERDTIYQVLRESLTNIRKHADASRVDVTIDLRSRPYCMVVEDDGVGIDPTAAAEKVGSFGILGMQERAELLGGRIDVGRNPRGGTRVALYGPATPLGGG